jgi:hypothetical protein
MSFPDLLHRIMAASSLSLSFIVILGLPALILGTTYFYTTICYYLALFKHIHKSSKPLSPPQVPYAIPFLGSSLSFLLSTPDEFWTYLLTKYPRFTGSYTLMLTGQRSHILFDPTAVQSLFKARGPTRDRFNYKVLENAFSMKKPEVKKYYGLVEPTGDKINRDPRFATDHPQFDYILRGDRVKELSEIFMKKLDEELAKDERLSDGKELEIGLAAWLRDHIFVASTYAFLGERLLEVYPELIQDYWGFDKAFLPLFFGLSKFMIPKQYESRDKVMSGMIRWHEVAWEECKGKPLDPDDASWEPIYGSRFNRARQRFYMYKGLTTHSKAATDMGMLFAFHSNAIPACSWMLLHILNLNGDNTLLPRVLAELETARGEEGVNGPVLLSLPLFQSILQEILRLYVDLIVSRDIHTDLVLPIGDGKRQLQFRKGDLVMAPSWLGQHDEEIWEDPPCNVFYAERFLNRNPDTGKDVFSLGGTAGKLFPFGGGKTICPGRVFAKQEILRAVATVLLNYDISPINFLNSQGNYTDEFPKLATGFPGLGVVPLDGDMKVRMKRKV